jgi:Domain of unknown function (DUF4260)
VTLRSTGYVTGTPRAVLRLEGLLVLVSATIVYARLDAGWWRFAILFLVPDLSMAGYLLGRKTGAAAYNAGHSYVLALGLIGMGVFWPVPQAMLIGLIWAAHIGLDRALGYGLKYADGFGSTHLGLIGPARTT